jgi:hypothetical protein
MQHQVLIRLPHELTDVVRQRLHEGQSEDLVLEVKPAHDGNLNKFDVQIEDNIYPAMLCNLPSPLETHKTLDNKVLYKSGNIGQILIVFMTEDQFLNHAKTQLQKLDGVTYLDSGITPPTTNIVQRKYSKTRRHNPQPPDKISVVADEILNLANNKEIVEEYEEIVDLEDWMINPETQEGRTITINSESYDLNSASTSDMLLLQKHPELLQYTLFDTQEQIERDEIEKRFGSTNGGNANITEYRGHAADR